ncbi:MAG: hypothetical protein ACM3XO_05220 [Bacteroidota bacterium]
MAGTNYDQRGQQVDQQYNAGRDVNFAIDAHSEENPFVEQEEYASAGCLAKSLMALGGLLLAGGALLFFGSVVMGMMSMGQAAASFPAGGYSIPSGITTTMTVAPLGFGVLIAGMIVYSIGRTMARNAAYKNRLRRQQRSHHP